MFEHTFPVLVELEKEGRAIFITIATIAGAILAFSFVPLQNETTEIVKNRTVFLVAEGLLALDIILAVVCAFLSRIGSYSSLHNIYNEQFDRITKIISIQEKYLKEGSISTDEQTALKNEYETKSTNKNSDNRIFKVAQWLVLILFVLGMAAIILSFVKLPCDIKI